MSKEERIAAERERLNKLFADLDENQQQTAAGLISSAAFLLITLQDLETEINAAGCIEEYTNGANQCGYKVSAACQAYAQLNTKYQSTIQKLLKIVPPAPKKKTAAQIAAEEERAKAEEREAREYERAEQRNADFLTAIRAGTASYEKYSEFCAEWEKEHASD